MSDDYNFAGIVAPPSGCVCGRDRGDDTGEFPRTTDKVRKRTDLLGVSATQFANAMSKAFNDAIVGGKKFDDVLKQLALRLSGMALSSALKPLFKTVFGDLGKVLKPDFGRNGGGSGGPPDILHLFDGVQPFAAGGVIGAPSYFPLASGGLGLAGEAGPEAILPLTRGGDGRLGVSFAGAAPANVTVQIVTPDPASFRRSEAYLTGQIARAVARGQRNF
jgi:phage-related minor tail protein